MMRLTAAADREEQKRRRWQKNLLSVAVLAGFFLRLPDSARERGRSRARRGRQTEIEREAEGSSSLTSTMLGKGSKEGG